MNYIGVFGFPGSGHNYVATLLQHYGFDVTAAGGKRGIVSWKAALPEFRPHELISRAPSAEGRNRRISKRPLQADPLIHLIRYPWHAISSAANLDSESIALIRSATKQGGVPLDTWQDKARICIRAFPKWYDLVRDLNPDFTLKIEELDSKWNELRKVLRMESLEAYATFGPDVKQSRKPYKEINYKLALELVDSTEASSVELMARNLYRTRV